MKRCYIAANWKMHMTRKEACALAAELVEKLKDGKHKYMVAPSFTLLPEVGEVLKGSNILLGAQNMAEKESGAFTGEVSVLQLIDAGVKVVILGHSERRDCGETDECINKKVKLALKHGLEVIICIGELLAERENGMVETVCRVQVTKALEGVSEAELKNVTIAYEPVWAIGTGKTPTPSEADIVHGYVRNIIENLYSKKAACEMVILYGGSMKVDNAEKLLSMRFIKGGLIGGAGLKTETFVPIALAEIQDTLD